MQCRSPPRSVRCWGLLVGGRAWGLLAALQLVLQLAVTASSWQEAAAVGEVQEEQQDMPRSPLEVQAVEQQRQ